MTADYRDGRRGIERMKAVRRLRTESTEAERAMWALVRGRRFEGSKFRRQHEFGPYILDFYCAEHRLAIEADGGQHFDPEVALNDAARREYLQSRGVRILRFSNLEILRESEGVASRILQALEEAPSPQPSPKGRGG